MDAGEQFFDRGLFVFDALCAEGFRPSCRAVAIPLKKLDYTRRVLGIATTTGLTSKLRLASGTFHG